MANRNVGMRIILSFILILAGQAAIFGQTAEEEAVRLKQDGTLQVEEAGRLKLDGTLQEDQRKGNFGLSVGTGFTYARVYGSGITFFAAPAYTLPLNDRWSFHGGIVATHYQSLNQTLYGETVLPREYSSLALFAAASYRMSERLVLHGTGVKQLVSAPYSPFTVYPMDNLSLGATYKLGNNITVGATIHLNNGQGYYATPYQGYGFTSPFYWAP
jgi:hypothetical protein